jgi:HK97 gp10 family phage protein
MSDLVNVKGLADLQKFLDQLTPKMEANVMRGALRAGMKKVKNRAALNINSQSGDLAKGLRISTRLKNGIVKSVLAARGPSGYKAMWVEFGTQRHLIKVQESEKKINYKRSKKLGRVVKESMTTINRRVLQIGNTFVGPVIEHPGSRPHPFMRPALDSEAQSAIIAAAEYMKARLEKKHGLDTSELFFEGEE